jgi:hypothetical protein
MNNPVGKNLYQITIKFPDKTVATLWDYYANPIDAAAAYGEKFPGAKIEVRS